MGDKHEQNCFKNDCVPLNAKTCGRGESASGVRGPVFSAWILDFG